jgi:hypothetical protein
LMASNLIIAVRYTIKNEKKLFCLLIALVGRQKTFFM